MDSATTAPNASGLHRQYDVTREVRRRIEIGREGDLCSLNVCAHLFFIDG
jgi:hypothetical protein